LHLSHCPTRTLAESGTAPIEENKTHTFIYLHHHTVPELGTLGHRSGTLQVSSARPQSSRISAVTEAEKLFNETYARWLHASSLIHGFRRSFTEVSDTVADRLQADLQPNPHCQNRKASGETGRRIPLHENGSTIRKMPTSCRLVTNGEL
jgi:hypothetical protein